MQRAMSINTTLVSRLLRERSIDLSHHRLLITDYRESQQEKDFSLPANGEGIGRVHHFYRQTSQGWPQNGLPIDPASKALGLPHGNSIEAEVFQNAACNWRCWYCYVPFEMLSANPKHSVWTTPSEMVDAYLSLPVRPPVIDLSGGQPDLVPEWVPWMMNELRVRGLEQDVYLWSDDNLSNDYFWRYLSDADRLLIGSYKNYGRVCCFKGFDAESFAFNTQAEPALFDQQFDLMRRLLTVGMDIYGYATFTAASSQNIAEKIHRFVDRLQDIHTNLPLRTMPLEIRHYSPLQGRMNVDREQSLEIQQIAIAAWQQELRARFMDEDLATNISDVSLQLSEH